jgi:hypothetical protein
MMFNYALWGLLVNVTLLRSNDLENYFANSFNWLMLYDIILLMRLCVIAEYNDIIILYYLCLMFGEYVLFVVGNGDR